jgi:hypothetical protein
MPRYQYVLLREDWENKEGTRLLGYELLGIYEQRDTGLSELESLVQQAAAGEYGIPRITRESDAVLGNHIGRVSLDQDSIVQTSVERIWKLCPQIIVD